MMSTRSTKDKKLGLAPREVIRTIAIVAKVDRLLRKWFPMESLVWVTYITDHRVILLRG